jgi:hypothetical protein
LQLCKPVRPDIEPEMAIIFVTSTIERNIARTQRDGEFKWRSYLRGIRYYPHRGVDAGHHGYQTTEYKSTGSPVLPLLNVMYCERVSLWTDKVFLAKH